MTKETRGELRKYAQENLDKARILLENYEKDLKFWQEKLDKTSFSAEKDKYNWEIEKVKQNIFRTQGSIDTLKNMLYM